MKISVVGTGYVGLVTRACLAEMGNEAVCFDVDAGKVEALSAGHIPIDEPGLEGLVAANLKAGASASRRTLTGLRSRIRRPQPLRAADPRAPASTTARSAALPSRRTPRAERRAQRAGHAQRAAGGART
jgi:hypothetical protein